MVVLGLGLGGCGCPRAAYSPPVRTQWPTLTAYPGTKVIEQQATPVTAQVLVFATEASREQVDQYYLDALQPQGWQRGASGRVIDLSTCPILWLVITPIAGTEARTTYRVSFGQEQCATYC